MGSARLRNQLSQPSGTIAGRLAQLALAVAFTLMMIQYSLRHGRLLLFPTFDDLSYFYDAAQRLQTFYDSGVMALAHGFLKEPPHSPYQTLESFFTYLIFGLRGWAPYVGNAGLILVFILLANWLARGLKTWHKVCLTLLVLSFPLVPYAATDCRPDCAAAVVTVAGVCTILGRPRRGTGFVRSPARHKIAAGALFGLAMLVKPSVCPVTVMVMGNCLLAASVCDWFDPSARKGLRARGSMQALRELLRAWVLCIAAFLVVAGPYFLIAGKTIAQYIWVNTFGSQSSIAKLQGSLAEHLQYYLVGLGGRMMLGDHWMLVAAIFVLGLFYVLVRRRRRELLRAAAYAWMLFFTFFICTGNQVKQPYLGLSFQVLFLFLAIVVLAELALSQRLRGQLPWADLIVLSASVLGILFFAWPAPWGDAGSEAVRAQRAFVDDIYQTIRDGSETTHPVVGVPWEKARDKGPTVLMTFTGNLNSTLLNFMALQNLTPMLFYDKGYSRSFSDYLKELDAADYVIVSDSDMEQAPGPGMMATYLPNWLFQDKLRKVLSQRTDYKLAAQIQYPLNHKNVYIFQRAGDFYGLKPISGLGPIEGPYLPSLPFHVHWGIMPGSRLEPVDAPPGSYELMLSGRCAVAGETMVVRLDGKEIGRHTFTSWKFEAMQVPVELPAGPHVISIDYSGAIGANPTFQMAVLYRELKLVKAHPTSNP